MKQMFGRILKFGGNRPDVLLFCLLRQLVSRQIVYDKF